MARRGAPPRQLVSSRTRGVQASAARIGHSHALCDCFFSRLNGLMSSMSASEETNPRPAPTVSDNAAPARRRRGHRGGRGRRGGGRGSRSTPAPTREPSPEAPPAESVRSAVPAETEITATPTIESAEATPVPAPVVSVPPPALPPQPRHRSEPLQQAITELNQIISDLREALADLEDVAELLEIAETQKLDDEKEIEALRRTLNQLQRGRERGQPRPAPPSQTLPTSGSHRVLPTNR
jgi:hypothetical protein